MKVKGKTTFMNRAHQCVMFCSRHSLKVSAVFSVLAALVVAGFGVSSFLSKTEKGSAATLPQLNVGIPVTNGSVKVAAKNPDGSYFLGGGFTFVGKHSGSGVPTDAVTGEVQAAFPSFNTGGYSFSNMPVSTAVSDGSGGWYVGGGFTQVGTDTTKQYFAHVLADGSIDAAFPKTNAPVLSMSMQGNILYIAGSFTQVGGINRHKVAAIDVTTKAVTSWWSASNSKFYYGTNANYPTIYSIVATPNTVYVGGYFNRVVSTSTTRNYLAAIGTSGTGTLSAWNPGANSMVYSMAIDGTRLWVGGIFNSAGGKVQNGIVALDTTKLITATPTNPIALPWNTACNSGVYNLALSGTTLYAAGNFYFENCGQTLRNGVAAFNTADNNYMTNLRPWSPALTEQYATEGVTRTPFVYAVTAKAGKVYIGGSFVTAGGQPRKNVAAFADDPSVSNPTPLPWNPGASGYGNGWGSGSNDQGGVQMLAADASGTQVFMGGGFAVAGGRARNNIVKLSSSGDIDASWDINLKRVVSGSWDSPMVDAIYVEGGTAYIGGMFTEAAGQTRRNLVAADVTTGAISSWNPDITLGGSAGVTPDFAWVKDIAGYNGKIYIATRYSGYDNSGGLFAFDAVSGAFTGWHPTISSSANYYADPKRIVVSSSGVYVLGDFDSADGTSLNGFAAFNHDGSLMPWSPNIQQLYGGRLQDMVLKNSQLYVLGSWIYINGAPHNLFTVDTLSGVIVPVDQDLTTSNGSIQGNVLVVSDDQTLLYAGGGDGVMAADFSGTPVAQSSPIYGGGSIHDILQLGSDVYGVGDFMTLGDYTKSYYHPNFIKLDMNPILPPDTQAPVVGSIAPTTTQSGTPTILSATVTDNRGVNLCYLNVNGSWIMSPAVITPSLGTSVTVSMTYTFPSDGTYTAKFACNDEKSNFAYGPDTTINVGQVVPADTTAPTSSATLTGTSGQNGWYTSSVVVALNAADNTGGSGIKEILYSTNGSTFTTATSSSAQTTITADGATTVYYYAVDVAGNIENVKTLLVKIDATAPQVVTLFSLPEFDNTNGVTLNWTPGADVTSGVQNYKIYRCSSSGAVCTPTAFQTSSTTGYADTGLSDNTKYFYKVAVVDNAGNESAFSGEASVTEDSTAPTTPVLDVITLNGFTNQTAVNLSWSAATDPNTLASGVQNYNVNKNSAVVATPTVRSYGDSGLVEGQTYDYKVSATDRASNTGQYSNTSSVTVDKTAPTSQASVISGILGFNSWYISDVTVEITATDMVSGVAKIEYSINGGAYQVYTGQFLVSSEGITTITYRAIDNADNVETPDNELTVQIDKTLPLANMVVTGSLGLNGWYTTPVSAVISGTDTGAGFERIEYSYDGISWSTYFAALNISSVGATSVYYRAVDKAGNLGLVTVETIFIDEGAPGTSHSLSGMLESEPFTDWYYGNVLLNLLAMDGIGESGVALTEYSLDGGATYQTHSTSTPVSLAPGSYSLMYRSKDSAGNVESLNGPFTIKIDADADTDNVPNNLDKCPNTPSGEQADADGCGPTQQDQDQDGVLDRQDKCTGLVGKPEFQGCPYALFTENDLHVHFHKTKEQGLSYNGYACLKDGKQHSNCKLTLKEGPIGDSRGETVSQFSAKVFTLNSLGVSDFGQLKKRCDDIYDGTYLSTGITPVIEFMSIPTSNLLGVPTIQDYLVLLRVHVTDPGTSTTYATTLCKTVKKDEYNYNYDKTKPKNDPVAKVKMKMTKTVKPTGIQLTPNEEVIFTGSMLSVTYPDVAFWEDGVRDYVYTYIFESEGDWSVDVCSLVPQDYKVAGVYDEMGNLVSTSDCMQAGIANETKVIAFEVNKLHSPTVFDVITNMTVKHKGKTKKVKTTSKSEVVKKTRLVRQKTASKASGQGDKAKKFDLMQEIFSRGAARQEQQKNQIKKVTPKNSAASKVEKKKVK